MIVRRGAESLDATVPDELVALIAAKAGGDARSALNVLELAWSNLLRLYDRPAALAWLFGINPRLGDRRPIDLIRAGRAEELMRAIRAERADSFA